MKNTGIIRRIDDLGRIVIPKEIRNTLYIKESDPLEIYLHDNMVCFKKLSPMFNNQSIIDTAMKMAKKENLNIAIYDTDKRFAGEETYPALASEDWRKNPHANFYDKLYDCFIFSVISNEELCGYIAIQKNQCLDEEIRYVEMIANYLSVVLEKK